MEHNEYRETALRIVSDLGLSDEDSFLVEAVVRGTAWLDVLYIDEAGHLSPLGLENPRLINECAHILRDKGAPTVSGIVEAMALLQKRTAEPS